MVTIGRCTPELANIFLRCSLTTEYVYESRILPSNFPTGSDEIKWSETVFKSKLWSVFESI